MVQDLVGPLITDITGGILAGPGIDRSVKVLAIIGDSLTAQNSTQPSWTYYSSIGDVTYYNLHSGNRLPLRHSHNLGVGGDSLSQIEARIDADLAALNPVADIVKVRGGTNDLPAATTAASMIASIDNIVASVQSYGAECHLDTIPPRDGLTGAQQSKRDEVNDHIRGLEDLTSDLRIIVLDLDLVLDDGTGEWITGYSTDGVHQNPTGANVMGIAYNNRIKGFYGTYGIADLGGTSIGPNVNFSGDGGNIGANFTGRVADDYDVFGFGGTGTRTAAKPTDNTQRITVNFSATGGSADNATIDFIANIPAGGGTYTAGDTVQVYADIEFVTSTNMRGPYLQLTDVGSSNISTRVHNRATGSLGGFTDSANIGRVLMVSEPLVTQGTSTSLAMEMECDFDNTSTPGDGRYVLHALDVLNLS